MVKGRGGGDGGDAVAAVEYFFFLSFVQRTVSGTYPHHMQKSNSMNLCVVW